MPRDLPVYVFVGIKNTVVALDDPSGVELWRTKLRSSDHVMVFWDSEALFAAAGGEIWRLDPKQGDVLWHNEMKGMGRGMVSIASSRRASTSTDFELAAEKRRRDAAAATTTAAASA